MNATQKLAVEAIKAATGWDTYQYDNGASVTQASQKPPLHLWRSEGEWVCSLGGFPTAIRSTPEAALEAVLAPYRVHIAGLAADILPNYPRLEWQGPISSRRLCLVTGRLVTPILTVYADPPGDAWMIEIGRVVGPQSTRVDVLAAMAAYVAGLELPCVLPDFPEVTHEKPE